MDVKDVWDRDAPNLFLNLSTKHGHERCYFGWFMFMCIVHLCFPVHILCMYVYVCMYVCSTS